MKLAKPELLSNLTIKEQELQNDGLLSQINMGVDFEHIPASQRTLYALILGTVKSAVSDYVRYRDSGHQRGRKLYKEAWVWLFCETDPMQDPFLGSFQWVCMFLDYDTDIIRQRIRRMTIQDLPKVDRRGDRDDE